MRRSDIQVASDPAHLYARESDGFAGMYLGQLDGGKPVFRFVGSDSIDRGPILDLLPKGTEIRVEEARYTLSQLEVIRDRVVAAEEQLAGVGILVVSEGIQDLTTAKEATVSDRIGPGLSFREDAPGIADACVNFWFDCFPLKGAVRVEETAFPAGGCTVGFLTKRDGNGQISLVTAGHCFVAHLGQGATWRHGNNDVAIGVASKNTWVENATADAGFIMLDAQDVPTDKNQLLYTASTPAVEVAVTSVDLVQTSGDSVCRNGYASGHDCGHIVDPDARHLSCYTDTQGVQHCVHIDETVEIDFDSTSGDSGGPTFWIASAMGTHIHSGLDSIPTSHSWYGTAKNNTDEYFDMWGVRYRYCLNDACSVTYP